MMTRKATDMIRGVWIWLKFSDEDNLKIITVIKEVSIYRIYALKKALGNSKFASKEYLRPCPAS